MADNNLSTDELFANAHEMAGGNPELLAQILEQVNGIIRSRRQATRLPRNLDEALAQSMTSRVVENDDSDTEPLQPGPGASQHPLALMTGQDEGKGRVQPDPAEHHPNVNLPRGRMQSFRRPGPSNAGTAPPPGTRGFNAAVARGQVIAFPTPEEEDEHYRAKGITPPTLPEVRIHINENSTLETFIDEQIRAMEESDARKEGRKAFRAEASRQREDARRWREESPEEFEQTIDNMEQTQVQEPLQNAAIEARSRPPIITGRVAVTARETGRIQGVGPVSAVDTVPQYPQVPHSSARAQFLRLQQQRLREAAASSSSMTSLHRSRQPNPNPQPLGSSTSAVIDIPVAQRQFTRSPYLNPSQHSLGSPGPVQSASQPFPPYQNLPDNTAPPAYNQATVNRPHRYAAAGNDPYMGAEAIHATPLVPLSWGPDQRAPGTNLHVQNQPGSQGFTIPSRRSAQATPSASSNLNQQSTAEEWYRQQTLITQSYVTHRLGPSGFAMPDPANPQARPFDTVNQLQQPAGQTSGDAGTYLSDLFRPPLHYQVPLAALSQSRNPPQAVENYHSRPQPSNTVPAPRPRTIRPTHGHTRQQNAGPDVQARRSRRGGDATPSGLQ